MWSTMSDSMGLEKIRQTEESIKDLEHLLSQRKEDNQRLKSYFEKTNNEIKAIGRNGEYDEKLYQIKQDLK